MTMCVKLVALITFGNQPLTANCVMSARSSAYVALGSFIFYNSECSSFGTEIVVRQL